MGLCQQTLQADPEGAKEEGRSGMQATRRPGCYRLGSERSLPMDVCCLSRKGRKDPKGNSEMTPGSTGQRVEGKGRAMLSLPLGQRTGPLRPPQSQPEPIAQGVTL